MIRFVDLKTGNIFDGGGPRTGSHPNYTYHPYTFWFENEQSIDLIHSHTICFVSDSPTANISMDQNEIFHLIDDSKLISDKISYDIETLYVDTISNKQGYFYRGLYIYMIYVTGKAVQEGEYLEHINIQTNNDNVYITIGADFYGENESLYINLSNNGVEIPSAIQKALYDSNVLEDKRNHILINRKFKELLSNYWDILANKGSYKSLLNSLKWFEYGDRLQLMEIWRTTDNKLLTQDVSDHMNDKYIESFDGLSKTTHYAISCALQSFDGWEGDRNDRVPLLKDVANKWSIEQMTMKLCLLGYFYKTCFMPIHLDLLFHTVENTVFMNNIRILSGGYYDRCDLINETKDIKCNIKDGQVFQLDIERCYVGPNTLFGNSIKDGSEVKIVGVQREPVDRFNHSINTPNGNKELGNYLAQLYNDVGKIIDFEIEIPLVNNDFIKQETIQIRKNGVIYETVTSHLMLGSKFDFSILLATEGEYSISMSFMTADGHIFIKNVMISVIDTAHVGLKLFKVRRNDTCNIGDIMADISINDYVFNRMPARASGKIYKQYIPTQLSGGGVGLNHLLVYSVRQTKLLNNYFEMAVQKEKKYYIYISKNFITNQTPIPHETGLYRQDFIFVPGFHHLEEFGVVTDITNVSLSDFVITDVDALCVIPDLSFSKTIEDPEWEFINVTTNETIRLDRSIREPFIAPDDKKSLTPGYYNIKFRYRLTGEDKINEIHWDSAFIKR